MTSHRTDAADIQQQMARLRTDLHRDVHQAVEQVRELTDWRYHVQHHPWLTLVAATAIGYLAVPRPLKVLRPDRETLAQLARDGKLVVHSQSATPLTAGFMPSLMRYLGGSLVRMAVSAAAQQAGKAWAPPTMNANDWPAEPVDMPGE